jgi:serine phosphatase RsbU (regulator of sigma subunit)
VNEGLNRTLRQTLAGDYVKDGMDIAFCCIDKENRILEYAGAYNPLYLFRDGELIETKANKFPIGISFLESVQKFTNNVLTYQPNDMVYVFSDGFPDQFGGPLGKKYKYDRFQQFLKIIHTKPLDVQKSLIEKEFLKWMGDLVQIDDVLILGFRLL